jgi:thiamine monophosphate kinase
MRSRALEIIRASEVPPQHQAGFEPRIIISASDTDYSDALHSSMGAIAELFTIEKELQLR